MKLVNYQMGAFMRNFLLTVVWMFVSAFGFSQTFSLVDCGMVGVGRSSIAWGDYDNDGDLDALVTGEHGSGPYIASIYKNNAGEFININAGLTGIYNSAVSWGDYDNDGDLDILASGRNSANSKTFIYQNNNGSFIQKELGLPEIGSDGAVAWGDYDGDDDLDILIAGNYICKLYKNTAGAFTDAQVTMAGLTNCWADWGDFDNDGDQDIFVMGDLGGILASTIYRNNNGVFSQVQQAGLVPLAGGSASWCDYDKDYDLDLLICGFNEFLEPETAIYENKGNMQFNRIYAGLIGTSLGTVAWGDYDNDGDADALLTGQNAGCGVLSSLVYRNDGNNVFNDINAPLQGASRGSAAWGDYDNDGDLDILISGFSGGSTPATLLYKNNAGSNTYSTNQPPSVPEGLSMFISGHTAVLGWLNSTDDHTPVNGITYNLRIGTTYQGQDIQPAQANPVTGKRLVSQPGNTGNNSAWIVNLPDGNYFWSVQAIDHTFAASAFAPDHVFTILNVGLNDETADNNIKVYPNPVSDNLMIVCNENFYYEISTSLGSLIRKSNQETGSAIMNTTGWEPGIYMVKIKLPDGEKTYKIVKN